ncbi:MAG TPA: hypothetical protein VE242_06460, partial [Chthoniobacterales bacterium]|nr:hypothetical protein [Chthoniobacterales bacterium]
MACYTLINIALNASSVHYSQIRPDVLAFFGNDNKLQKVTFRIEQSLSQKIPCDDFAFDSVAVAQIFPGAFFGISLR